LASKVVIIPIEVKVRDFHSRLLLGLLLVKNNYKVIFGSQRSIKKYIKYIAPGIYFDKSLAINKVPFYQELVKRKFKIISIDEEGLSSKNNQHKYVTQRVASDTLDLVEKVFTWGKYEKDVILNAYPKFNKKVIDTGNIRVDLYEQKFKGLYSDVSDILLNQYGRYLLFPSSFTVNHVLGQENQIKNLRNLGRIKTDKDYQFYEDRNNFFEKTFGEYFQLVKKVALAFKDYSIIVRPHPSESKKMWASLAKDHKNVFIRTDNSVAPWIIGAECIIHSSCTTGMEAFLLDKAVIAYLPYKDHEFVSHISNKLSKECNTANQVLGQLKLVREYKDIMIDSKDSRVAFLKDYLSNLEGTPAYNRILQEIDAINISDQNFVFQKISIRNKIKFIFKDLIVFLLSNVRERRYNKQKLSYINKQEIIKEIIKYQQILPELENFNFVIHKKANDLFSIN
jgi:surface carbohydrate biosynthesis protein